MAASLLGKIVKIKKIGTRAGNGLNDVASNHRFKIGEKVEIISDRSSDGGYYVDEAYNARSLSNGSSYMIYKNEIALPSITKETIEQQIEETKERIKFLHEEIEKFEGWKKILDDNDVTEIDEDALELSRVLATLDSSENNLKKAMKIKQFLSNSNEFAKKQRKDKKNEAKVASL